MGMRAQYDVAFSHYFDMEPSFNPASVGKYDKLNIKIKRIKNCEVRHISAK